jgi:hypothetical protein
VAVAVFACSLFFEVGRLTDRADDSPAASLFLLPLEYANLLAIAACWLTMTYVITRNSSILAKSTNVSPRKPSPGSLTTT